MNDSAFPDDKIHNSNMSVKRRRSEDIIVNDTEDKDKLTGYIKVIDKPVTASISKIIPGSISVAVSNIPVVLVNPPRIDYTNKAIFIIGNKNDTNMTSICTYDTTESPLVGPNNTVLFKVNLRDIKKMKEISKFIYGVITCYPMVIDNGVTWNKTDPSYVIYRITKHMAEYYS